MRIAQVSPLAESVPPELYGGTERIVAFLTDELVALGMMLPCSPAATRRRAKLRAIGPEALRLAPSNRDQPFLYTRMIEEVAASAGEFDIVHFHCYWSICRCSRVSASRL